MRRLIRSATRLAQVQVHVLAPPFETYRGMASTLLRADGHYPLGAHVLADLDKGKIWRSLFPSDDPLLHDVPQKAFCIVRVVGVLPRSSWPGLFRFEVAERSSVEVILVIIIWVGVGGDTVCQQLFHRSKVDIPVDDGVSVDHEVGNISYAVIGMTNCDREVLVLGCFVQARIPVQSSHRTGRPTALVVEPQVLRLVPVRREDTSADAEASWQSEEQ